jgi:hypothetical protein
VAAVNRLIPVRVGDVEIEVEAVPVAGTAATAGRVAARGQNSLEAFGRAQDAIVEVARSTAELIDRAGNAARPDRVQVEFGLLFSASGAVIMARVADEATLKVTLGYDAASRPSADAAIAADPALAPAGAPPAGVAGRIVVMADARTGHLRRCAPHIGPLSWYNRLWDPAQARGRRKARPSVALMRTAIQRYAFGDLTSNAEPASQPPALAASQGAPRVSHRHEPRRAEPRRRVHRPGLLAEGHVQLRPPQAPALPRLPRSPRRPHPPAGDTLRRSAHHAPRCSLIL